VNQPDALEQLISELEDVAERLRSGELQPDEAAELVQHSADLAGRLGSELDARGRSAGRLEGQERLL
jgi:exonuclease VII small subunit